jgi:hypothetical protein
LASSNFSSSLDELFSPFLETVIARATMVRGNTSFFLQPIDEQLFVLFQQQKLTEQHIGLVESLKNEKLDLQNTKKSFQTL